MFYSNNFQQSDNPKIMEPSFFMWHEYWFSSVKMSYCLFSRKQNFLWFPDFRVGCWEEREDYIVDWHLAQTQRTKSDLKSQRKTGLSFSDGTMLHYSFAKILKINFPRDVPSIKPIKKLLDKNQKFSASSRVFIIFGVLSVIVVCAGLFFLAFIILWLLSLMFSMSE